MISNSNSSHLCNTCLVRFLDPANGDYIGPVMVAKESRFAGEYHSQMAYHKNFMRTQNIAASFGRRFNDALDEAEKYFDTSSQAFIRGLPRILFIEPMVVELIDNESEKNILIERYLVGDYKKVRSSEIFYPFLASSHLASLIQFIHIFSSIATWDLLRMK